MINRFTSTSLLASTFALSLGTASASAAIVWGDSVDLFQGLTTQDFVNTSGNLAVAYNATTSDGENATVNGVEFVAQTNGTALFGPAGATGESIRLNIGSRTAPVVNASRDNVNAFSDGQFSRDGAIFNLLQGATFNLNSVTLGGLTIGQDYLVQTFVHDGRGNRNNNFVSGYGDGTDSDSPEATLELSNRGNTSEFAGETGDTIIGTFTADAATLTFNVFGTTTANATPPGALTIGNGAAQINGIQLRAIQPTAIPEPASLALIPIGMLVLAGRRKEKI